MMKMRWLIWGLLAIGTLGGCGDCADEVAAANDFLETPEHLACQSDDDCTVVSTGCGEPRRSFCGQATLNRSSAESAEWKRISEGLADCESQCSQCDGALLAECSQGFCGGPTSG